jgi:AraC-like DNA-binding protein
MQPVLEHLPLNPEESFVVRKFEYPFYPTPWHFHPEFEIVLVTESTGKRFIGDSISDFGPGDMALLGPNLPHLYRNDPEYYQGKNSKLRARSVVVHFLENSLGTSFFLLPEAKLVRSLLVRSRQGLQIHGSTRLAIRDLLDQLFEQKGFQRVLTLLQMLQVMAQSEELSPISRAAISGKNEMESHRMNTVLEYVLKNFHRDISVQEVAQQVNLANNSFSRYFSQRTRKTFVSFVNEVRLEHSIRMLQENKLSVSQICFACGFNNLSNFNRQFRLTYNMSPLAYARQLNKKN